MVSVLVPGVSGLGSSPCWGHCVVFLRKTLNCPVPLSTQKYEWVPANCWGKPNKLRGNDLRWTSIPYRGSRNTPSHFKLHKLGIHSGSYDPVESKATCTCKALKTTSYLNCTVLNLPEQTLHIGR